MNEMKFYRGNYASPLCKRMMLAGQTGGDAAEYLRERFPRLIRHMQWVAILSRYEASYALRDYVYGRDQVLNPGLLRYGGGEAVCHYGGPLRVIKHAIEWRHRIQPVLANRGVTRELP